MKVFSVVGYSQTGKTTVVERVVAELRRRGFSVTTIKEIACQDFQIDRPGSNTDRHRQAGADLVVARGPRETDLLYRRRLSVPEILAHCAQDYVVCEGVTDFSLPRIVTGETPADLDERWSEAVFAVSGKVAATLGAYCGVPAIDVLAGCSRLVDLIEEKVGHLPLGEA